ncbi:hypothetical protein PS691_02676 [Pseudomonas fluorescens]|uniref:Uncharacterized protein n=1 Tax=Pseudomonas fluorescens TaxID=294 RepID=A0A5E7CP83_PSEFL|nr:hypothetical protein PS691_02676 [Pseudomonas fluorescens]
MVYPLKHFPGLLITGFVLSMFHWGRTTKF